MRSTGHPNIVQRRVLVGVAATLVLLGSAVLGGGLSAGEGWCCIERGVVAATDAECEERGGSFFMNRDVAQRRCTPATPAPKVEQPPWCCLERQVLRVPESECLERGGRPFAMTPWAERRCRRPAQQAPADDEGWCCHDGRVVRAPLRRCVDQGGRFDRDRDVAERLCERGPDLPGEPVQIEFSNRVVDELEAMTAPDSTFFAERALFEPGEARCGYFETPLGLRRLCYELGLVDGEPAAVLEGDIVLSLDREIPPEKARRLMQQPVPLLAGLDDWKMLWPKAVVPYDIAPGTGKAEYVQGAIDIWQAATKFKFRRRTAADDRFVLFKNHSGPWQGSGQIGRQPPGPTLVRFGTKTSAGLVAHEIGHAVGLFHEHTRFDRDQFVTVIWKNIQSAHTDNFEPKPNAVGDWGPYDIDSLMHYGSYAFSKVDVAKIVFSGLLGLPLGGGSKAGYTVGPTLTELDGTTFDANRSGLSALDVAYIDKLYSWYCGATSPPSVTKLTTASSGAASYPTCSARTLVMDTDDYMKLHVQIASTTAVELPADFFQLALITPGPDGKPDTAFARNPGPSGTQQLSTIVLDREIVLPGHHELRLRNYLHDDVAASYVFQPTPAVLPKDEFDMQGVGDSVDNPADLGLLPGGMLLSRRVEGLTLHEPGDVDYFRITLPADPYGGYCTKAKGAHGADVLPGELQIFVTRQDQGRVLRTVVYKDGDPNALKPFGWEKRGKIVSCPHDQFAQQGDQIVFSIEECSERDASNECLHTKRGIYDLRLTYVPTVEDIPPKELPTLDYRQAPYRDDPGLFAERCLDLVREVGPILALDQVTGRLRLRGRASRDGALPGQMQPYQLPEPQPQGREQRHEPRR